MTNLHHAIRSLAPALRGRALVAACCLWAAVAGGCVHRRLTVRSQPEGATVYVDDREIGSTPVSTDYVYYGTRKIRLVKDGYETMTVLQRVPPPWYQYFPLDFVAENLIPYDIRDERVLDYRLQPQTVVPGRQLLERAENLRQGSRVGAAPLTPSTPAGLGPAAQPSSTTAPGAFPPTTTAPTNPPAAGPAATFAPPPLPSPTPFNLGR